MNESFYVIRLKDNVQLAKLAETFILIDDGHPWEKKKFATILRLIEQKVVYKNDEFSLNQLMGSILLK